MIACDSAYGCTPLHMAREGVATKEISNFGIQIRLFTTLY